MKAISAALKTLLQTSKQVLRVELLTITLQQGAGVYRFNSSPADIVYGGNTYLAPHNGANLGFKRGTVKTSIGTAVNNMQLTLIGSVETLIGGVPLCQFAEGGGFDNAIIEVDCLPMPVGSWGDASRGTYNIWSGVVADVKGDGLSVQLNVASRLRILQQAFPPRTTIPTCNHTLFDPGCTLNKAAYMLNGVVSAGAWTTAAFDSSRLDADDYFDLGWIVWTSGANNGLVRTVKSFKNAGGAFTLTYPLPNVPAAGDTFDVYPGCDKTLGTCTAKFGNQLNFGGFPYVPNPMTIQAGQGANTPGGSITPVGGGIGGPGGADNNFKQK